MTLSFQSLQLQILRWSNPVSMNRQTQLLTWKVLALSQLWWEQMTPILWSYQSSPKLIWPLENFSYPLTQAGATCIYLFSQDSMHFMIEFCFFSSPLMSIKLSTNQGGIVWGKCSVSIINPPNPYGWGYQEFPQILPTTSYMLLKHAAPRLSVSHLVCAVYLT